MVAGIGLGAALMIGAAPPQPNEAPAKAPAVPEWMALDPAVDDEGGATCEAPAPAVLDEAALATSLEGSAGPGEVEAMARPGCKNCKDRPWCACTYNGKPRISCNPCCYQGWSDPFPVCFD